MKNKFFEKFLFNMTILLSKPNFSFYFSSFMGIGDWGLGIGDWAQSPIPNPQSPIPNPQFFRILISNQKYF
jgi:hypothetical protein